PRGPGARAARSRRAGRGARGRGGPPRREPRALLGEGRDRGPARVGGARSGDRHGDPRSALALTPAFGYHRESLMNLKHVAAAAALALAGVLALARAQEGTPPMKRENRLARARSPYLLQHKDNPVDWYEWGDEAFEKARREQKPIFLSVGYS